MTDPLTQWLDKMSAKCRAATPGPWRIPGANIGRVVAPEAPHSNPREGKCPPYPWAVVAETDSRSVTEWHHNAAYLAALPPETVSALLECVRAAALASDEIQSQHTMWPGEVDTLHDALARLREIAGREG